MPLKNICITGTEHNNPEIVPFPCRSGISLTVLSVKMRFVILYGYLPKSELGPGLTLLFFQLFSYASAALCVIVHGIGLYLSRKNGQGSR